MISDSKFVKMSRNRINPCRSFVLVIPYTINQWIPLRFDASSPAHFPLLPSPLYLSTLIENKRLSAALSRLLSRFQTFPLVVLFAYSTHAALSFAHACCDSLHRELLFIIINAERVDLLFFCLRSQNAVIWSLFTSVCLLLTSLWEAGVWLWLYNERKLHFVCLRSWQVHDPHTHTHTRTISYY